MDVDAPSVIAGKQLEINAQGRQNIPAAFLKHNSSKRTHDGSLNGSPIHQNSAKKPTLNNNDKRIKLNNAGGKCDPVQEDSSEEENDVIFVPLPPVQVVTIEDSDDEEKTNENPKNQIDNSSNDNFVKPLSPTNSIDKRFETSSCCTSPSSIISYDDFIGQNDRQRVRKGETFFPGIEDALTEPPIPMNAGTSKETAQNTQYANEPSLPKRKQQSKENDVSILDGPAASKTFNIYDSDSEFSEINKERNDEVCNGPLIIDNSSPVPAKSLASVQQKSKNKTNSAKKNSDKDEQVVKDFFKKSNLSSECFKTYLATRDKSKPNSVSPTANESQTVVPNEDNTFFAKLRLLAEGSVAADSEKDAADSEDGSVFDKVKSNKSSSGKVKAKQNAAKQQHNNGQDPGIVDNVGTKAKNITSATKAKNDIRQRQSGSKSNKNSGVTTKTYEILQLNNGEINIIDISNDDEDDDQPPPLPPPVEVVPPPPPPPAPSVIGIGAYANGPYAPTDDIDDDQPCCSSSLRNRVLKEPPIGLLNRNKNNKTSSIPKSITDNSTATATTAASAAKTATVTATTRATAKELETSSIEAREFEDYYVEFSAKDALSQSGLGWSEEQSRFYGSSWDGEKFEVDKLLSSMSKDKKLWKINQSDKLRLSLRTRDSKLKCFNCNNFGHRRQDCPMTQKPKVCRICGEEGHQEPGCPHKCCLRCGAKAKSFFKCCNACAFQNRVKCKICRYFGHNADNCPDRWRRYHSTTKNVEKLNQNVVLKKRAYCSNCGKGGHFIEFCRKEKLPRDYPTVTSKISSYERSYKATQTVAKQNGLICHLLYPPNKPTEINQNVSNYTKDSPLYTKIFKIIGTYNVGRQKRSNETPAAASPIPKKIKIDDNEKSRRSSNTRSNPPNQQKTSREVSSVMSKATSNKSNTSNASGTTATTTTVTVTKIKPFEPYVSPLVSMPVQMDLASKASSAPKILNKSKETKQVINNEKQKENQNQNQNVSEIQNRKENENENEKDTEIGENIIFNISAGDDEDKQDADKENEDDDEERFDVFIEYTDGEEDEGDNENEFISINVNDNENENNAEDGDEDNCVECERTNEEAKKKILNKNDEHSNLSRKPMGPTPDFIPIETSDESLDEIPPVIETAKIALTEHHANFLATVNGKLLLSQISKDMDVEVKFETSTAAGKILVLKGPSTNLEPFQNLLMEAFVKFSKTLQTTRMEITNQLPRRAGNLVRFLRDELAILKKRHGYPYDVYQRLLSYERQMQYSKNSVKAINKLRRLLNVILIGQAGLVHGKIHIENIYEILADLVRNYVPSQKVPVHIYEKLFLHWKMIFAPHEYTNYPELLNQYRELDVKNFYMRLKLDPVVLGENVLDTTLTAEQLERMNNVTETQPRRGLQLRNIQSLCNTPPSQQQPTVKTELQNIAIATFNPQNQNRTQIQMQNQNQNQMQMQTPNQNQMEGQNYNQMQNHNQIEGQNLIQNFNQMPNEMQMQIQFQSQLPEQQMPQERQQVPFSSIQINTFCGTTENSFAEFDASVAMAPFFNQNQYENRFEYDQETITHIQNAFLTNKKWELHCQTVLSQIYKSTDSTMPNREYRTPSVYWSREAVYYLEKLLQLIGFNVAISNSLRRILAKAYNNRLNVDEYLAIRKLYISAQNM